MIEELHLRGFSTQRTEFIAKMKAMAIDHEHPSPSKAEENKNLYPELLAASDWSKYALDVSLANLNATRSIRT